MTEAQFRKIALALPGAVESEHMNHPDFRVRGRIFAAIPLAYRPATVMIKLTPDQQREFMNRNPAAFSPISGGWGKRGATQVRLAAVKPAILRQALFTAWCNIAPKTLIAAALQQND